VNRNAFVTSSIPTASGCCFGSISRKDIDGEQIRNFKATWSEAVTALGVKMKADGLEPIDLHVHDLRRSAHYQMRKAGIDPKTRRAIMGHKTGSMDDRYTIIDDEALADATDKMKNYQKERGMIADELHSKVATLSQAEWNKLVALRKRGSATR